MSKSIFVTLEGVDGAGKSTHIDFIKNYFDTKKINFYLKFFKHHYSGRKIFIAKELTKIHETFFRNNIDDLKTFNYKVKGELTVIVSEKNIEKK